MVKGLGGKPRLIQEGDEVSRGQELASVRKVDYEQQLAAASAARRQAEASQMQAQLDLARTRALVDSGALPHAQLESDSTHLAVNSAVSSEAAARVDQAALALRDASIRSPMNGTLIRRSIEVGALALVSTVAFTVADISSVNVVFAIPDVRLPFVRLGETHSVQVDALAGVEWKGTVTRISPSADPGSHVFEIQLEIENRERRLKPGMVAALSLPIDNAGARLEPRLLIPLASVVRSPNADGFVVYLVAEESGVSVARPRSVKLGEYTGSTIVVEQGLAEGDRIVVQGSGLVADGERVEVLP